MKRVNFHLTDQQLAWLRGRQAETGVPVAEQIRRAIDKERDRAMTTIRTSADMSISLGCGVEIADEAARIGVVPKFVRDNGGTGDRRVSLWRVGGAEALNTNGGAIWDTKSAEDWAQALEACGLTV
jgi:hypothetical protein